LQASKRLLRFSASKFCNAGRCALRLLYLQFIRPVIDYASPAWSPLLPSHRLQPLIRIQSQCARIITGCLSSTPISLLNIELSIPSIVTRLQQLSVSYYARIPTLPHTHPVKQQFSTWLFLPSHISVFSFDHFSSIVQSIGLPIPFVPTSSDSSLFRRRLRLRSMSLWLNDPHYSRPLMSYSHIRSSCRSLEVLLARLRTGHVLLNHYLHKISMAPFSLCPNCFSEETVHHLFFVCPAYHHYRDDLFADLSLIYRLPRHCISLFIILGDSALYKRFFHKSLASLFNFLVATNRFPSLHL
jgi:hypothetical protein